VSIKSKVKHRVGLSPRKAFQSTIYAILHDPHGLEDATGDLDTGIWTKTSGV